MGDKSALYSSLEIHVDFQSIYRLRSLIGTDIDCDWVAEGLTYMGLPGQDMITKQEYHPIRGDLETGKVYRAQLRRSGASEDTASLTVALKWATTADTIDRLYNEACIYEGNLKRLQGTFVPKFYGLFLAKIGVTPVCCIVLEWCCGTPTQDIRELNRQKMLATAQIHSVGVDHGLLKDGHHFVVDSRNRLRIVDFGVAYVHECKGGIPLLKRRDENTPEVCSECRELRDMENTFGPDTGGDAEAIRRANDLGDPDYRERYGWARKEVPLSIIIIQKGRVRA